MDTLDAPTTRLDPETEQAARGFIDRIRGAWPVLGAVLYGSRARGDFHADSDIDLAVILDGPADDRNRDAIRQAACGFNPEGARVSPLVVWREQWDHPERFPARYRLLRNVRRDGILVDGEPDAIRLQPWPEPPPGQRTAELNEQAKHLLKLAEGSLRVARLALDAGEPSSACNRAYYAMFDGARAALHLAGASEAELRAKTHQALRANFHRLLLRDGTLPRELGPWLDTAEEDRIIADYGTGPLVLAPEDVARHVEAAGRFLEAIRARFADALRDGGEPA